MSVRFTALSIAVFSLFAAGAVHAQSAGVVTLRANATSGQSGFVPVLTWSTTPSANSCSAGGGWSGAKSFAGSQTLSAIRATTSYTLTCTWGTASKTVSWTPPTTNSNGSTLTDLTGYRVYYGTSSSALTQMLAIPDMTSRSATVSGLTPGTWYFAVRSLNSRGAESSNSNVTSRAVTGATAAGSLNITITTSTPPPPNPSTRRTIATTVYDTVVNASGRRVVGRTVGTIPIGTACRSYYLGGEYYGVSTSLARITRTPRSTTVVALCAIG